MTDTESWAAAQNKFTEVLEHKTTSDGEPERYHGGHRFLPTSDLVLYCDYKRFNENKNCRGNPKPGYTCATIVDQELLFNKIYSDCKRNCAFSTSSVQVGEIYTEVVMQSQMLTSIY